MVDQQRIEAVGKGDAEPVAGNDNAAGRAQNRRVEMAPVPKTSNAAKP